MSVVERPRVEGVNPAFQSTASNGAGADLPDMEDDEEMNVISDAEWTTDDYKRVNKKVRRLDKERSQLIQDA